MNGRTALGACLVQLAVLAGALFLDRSQQLAPVYVAAHDLPAGVPLREGDLIVIRSASRQRRSGTTCGRVPVRRCPVGSSARPSVARRSSRPGSSSPPFRRPTWSSCRSRSTRATWPRGCGRATACRSSPPTPRALAGPGGRPAAIRRGRAGSPGPRRPRRHRRGARRPAPHAQRPSPTRGSGHRHRPDLRRQGSGRDLRAGPGLSGDPGGAGRVGNGAGVGRVGTGRVRVGHHREATGSRRAGTRPSRVRPIWADPGSGAIGSGPRRVGTRSPFTRPGGGHVKVRLVTDVPKVVSGG
jgi:hypothetical protein